VPPKKPRFYYDAKNLKDEERQTIMRNLLVGKLAIASLATILAVGLAFAQNKTSDKPAYQPVWPQAHGIVLLGDQATSLIKQCSRPALKNTKGMWIPSANQIALMEQRLDLYLGKHYPAIRKNIGQLYFQYAGLIRNKKKFIYINTLDQHAQANPDWRHTAMIICDGGDTFWGLEYDPVTHQFSEMTFNSSMPNL
jgi:hypothetical protein